MDWKRDEERSAAVINNTSVDGAEITSTNEAVVSAVQDDIVQSARLEVVICTHEGGEEWDRVHIGGLLGLHALQFGAAQRW